VRKSLGPLSPLLFSRTTSHHVDRRYFSVSPYRCSDIVRGLTSQNLISPPGLGMVRKGKIPSSPHHPQFASVLIRAGSAEHVDWWDGVMTHRGHEFETPIPYRPPDKEIRSFERISFSGSRSAIFSSPPGRAILIDRGWGGGARITSSIPNRQRVGEK
jgi:hypothetical protein